MLIGLSSNLENAAGRSIGCITSVSKDWFNDSYPSPVLVDASRRENCDEITRECYENRCLLYNLDDVQQSNTANSAFLQIVVETVISIFSSPSFFATHNSYTAMFTEIPVVSSDMNRVGCTNHMR